MTEQDIEMAQQRADAALIEQGQQPGRSPQEQLARLDARLGKGVGATRERKRLEAMLTPKQQGSLTEKQTPVKSTAKSRRKEGK